MFKLSTTIIMIVGTYILFRNVRENPVNHYTQCIDCDMHMKLIWNSYICEFHVQFIFETNQKKNTKQTNGQRKMAKKSSSSKA